MIVYLRKQSGINCPTLEAGFDFMIKYNIKTAMVSRDQIYQHQRSHLIKHFYDSGNSNIWMQQLFKITNIVKQSTISRTILNENVCL